MADPLLLSDNQIQRFIVDGELALPIDELGQDFHQNVYNLANERKPQGALSQEIDLQMPELEAVLQSATVRGALLSLLGPGYIRHPHTAAYVQDITELERGTPGNFEQGWHRDSYWGVQRMRHHRPRWLICMYYPADVTPEMGPTAIAPGSQYFALPHDGDGSVAPPTTPIAHNEIDDPEGIMQGPNLKARDRMLAEILRRLGPGMNERAALVTGGTFCCFHYDLYHRRMRRPPNDSFIVPPRVMFKFLFTTGCARTAPTWNHRHKPDWNNEDRHCSYRVIWQSVWESMVVTLESGPAVLETGEIAIEKAALLQEHDEIGRMQAAYELGALGRTGNSSAITALVECLQQGEAGTIRAAGNGLAAAGPAAVEPLLDLLRQVNITDPIACSAVHALGEAVDRPSVVIVELVAAIMQKVEHKIDVESGRAGGWPAGGGGHPAHSGFPNKSPNPKESQAWPPKLLHASCLQALGLMGQRALATEVMDVVEDVTTTCIICLEKPEPGGGNPDYPRGSYLGSGCMSRQNAALALRMLCTDRHTAVTKRTRDRVRRICSTASSDEDKFIAHYCIETLKQMPKYLGDNE